MKITDGAVEAAKSKYREVSEQNGWDDAGVSWPSDEPMRQILESALPHMGGVEIKPLEWEDADEGMCTKWRAAALGGHYELVSFDKEPGFAVNFHWGRPLSFWFIQGDPDEWGPTGPKMFPTLEEAKAAARADYERRIMSDIEVSASARAVTDEEVARAAAQLMQYGLNAPESTIYAAAKAALASHEPAPEPAKDGPEEVAIAWKFMGEWRVDFTVELDKRKLGKWFVTEIEPLVRLSDAQRIIAERDAEIERLKSDRDWAREERTLWEEHRDAAEARIAELVKALDPFVGHLNEMKFDLDHEGNELPDKLPCGWVYLTLADFRRARAALKEKSDEA